MGEYAKYENTAIKIGTCNNMYYLRFEDRSKVQAMPGNVNPANKDGLRFRLPFPDEDHLQPGAYRNHDRSFPLYRGTENGTEYFSDAETVTDPGIIQLSHESGLLVNVTCYHGERLPGNGPDTKMFWNGKAHCLELAQVKILNGKLYPVVHCRFCGHAWRYEWDDILPFVSDPEMKARLEFYATYQS